jgi:hypothetical protein
MKPVRRSPRITFFLVPLAIAAVALGGAGTASADRPTVRHFQDVFVDVNPCTGLEHTVTIDVTAYSTVPLHTNHATHTVSTSSGFVGRGVEVGIFDDNTFLANDMLVNAATGERIHAQLIVVVNPVTGTSQVLRQTLTCIPVGQPS